MNPLHTDWALSRRIRAGDERAFRELFEHIFPRLFRFALARLDGNRTEAREVVQLTFCRAFEHMGSYRGECSLYGWFCQICRNAIADRGRALRYELECLSAMEEDATLESLLEALQAPASEEPEAVLLRTELGRLIQAALDCLPGHYGDVLEWKYVEGLSVKEIGERLAIGTKAAESCLTRARGAFRAALTEIGGSLDVLAEATREPT
jgi:RNA polymerase sigma-70 factor (ECF subfamily)